MSILYALLDNDNDNDDDGGHLGGSLGGPAASEPEPELRGMQKLTNGRELDAWPARENRRQKKKVEPV